MADGLAKTKPPARFQTLLFDFDGTVADTGGAILGCLSETFAQQQRPQPDQAVIESSIGLPLSAVMGRLGVDEADLADAIALYRAIYQDRGMALTRLMPDMDKLLRAAHRHRHQIVVVSNKGEAAIHQFFAQSGLSDCIDAIFGDRSGRPKKPDPALLTDHILPQLDIATDQNILVIGDTETDIKLGKNAGLATCWVSFGYGDKDACIALGPDFRADTVGELAIQLGLELSFLPHAGG